MDPDSVDEAGRVPHGGSSDPDVLDLSANTNPRTPAGTRTVYEAAFDDARRYPDDGYPAFRRAAANVVDCAPEAVVPTAGGLAAIRLALEVALEPGDSALVPRPSFGEYAREITLQGADPVFVDHRSILAADPARHELAVVCTPNNPTGEALEREALLDFAARCRETDTLLLVDEAFLGFTDRDSIAGADGVIVARSLTKLYGLPGIRAGYAVATGEVGEALATGRRAWSLSTPAAAVGTHCLQQPEFVAETCERVRRERSRLRAALAPRFEVFPSEAPFLLVDVGAESVDALLTHAREQGVVLRDARTFRSLDSHVRLAVKDRQATDRLLEVLDVRDDP